MKFNYMVSYEDDKFFYFDKYIKKSHAKGYYKEALEEGFKNVKIIKIRRK